MLETGSEITPPFVPCFTISYVRSSGVGGVISVTVLLRASLQTSDPQSIIFHFHWVVSCIWRCLGSSELALTFGDAWADRRWHWQQRLSKTREHEFLERFASGRHCFQAQQTGWARWAIDLWLRSFTYLFHSRRFDKNFRNGEVEIRGCLNLHVDR